jgi:hypothetical protein
MYIGIEKNNFIFCFLIFLCFGDKFVYENFGGNIFFFGTFLQTFFGVSSFFDEKNFGEGKNPI